MKNIYLINKPSIEILGVSPYGKNETAYQIECFLSSINIYIVSNDDSGAEYVFWEGKTYKYREFMKMKTPVYTDYFFIILTTDRELIKTVYKLFLTIF